MSTTATPFERVVKMDKSNSDLILAGEDGFHPVNDIPDTDWLSRLFIDHRIITNTTLSGKLYGRTARCSSYDHQPSVASTTISKC